MGLLGELYITHIESSIVPAMQYMSSEYHSHTQEQKFRGYILQISFSNVHGFLQIGLEHLLLSFYYILVFCCYQERNFFFILRMFSSWLLLVQTNVTFNEAKHFFSSQQLVWGHFYLEFGTLITAATSSNRFLFFQVSVQTTL